ncbi:MAG: sulfatase-like hydrolase/transferase [Solirubrobacterales bacterium]|nr:sulfatase-like hydrolase/transferase [Solirubrobacterales bacterium]
MAVLAAVLVLLLVVPADRALAARPNFVVIQTDDQSAASVRARLRGQVGGFRPVMPHAVRQILQRGTEFRNYYATSPVCSPSRASLLSGQYSWNHGIESNLGMDGGWTGWRNHRIFRHNLAVTLNRRGYRTSHFGKFTNGYYDEANNRVDRTVPPGWDRWVTTAYRPGIRVYGYELNVNGRPVGPVGDPDYGERGPGIDPDNCDLRPLRSVWPAGNCRYLGDVMTAAAVREIRRAHRQPFYVQIDYQVPHSDVAAPRGPQPATRYLGTASRTRLPRPPSFNERDFSDKPALIRNLAANPLNLAEVRRLRSSYRRYLESLRSVDDGIGTILRTLRRLGELRRTYVFLLSDHGLFLGEHRYDWGKFMPYEESASPLMAVRGPGVRRGRVSRELVGNLDVPVTIMRLAGARPDYQVDGRSLRPYWRRPGLRSERPVAITIDSRIESEGASASARAPALRYRGFRMGRYKYVAYDLGGEELYDLATDPRELENRAGSPRYERALAYMRRHLDEVTGCEGAACRKELPRPPKPG